MSSLDDFYKKFFSLFGIKEYRKLDSEQLPLSGKERFIVFIGAYLIALALWLMVNLNREYTLTVEFPVEVSSKPAGKALLDQPPAFVEVSINGEGIKLLNVFRNPPIVTLNVSDEAEINIFDKVREILNTIPDVNLSKVQPSIIRLRLEDEITKKIPVEVKTNISFANRFDFVAPPQVSPDSINIRGAKTLINSINSWLLPEPIELKEVKENINLEIPLQTHSLIAFSHQAIVFSGVVEEFTETEATVVINTRDLPRGKIINYNPSSIVIRFDVPISQYAELSTSQNFDVFVPYRKILEDTTGFVTPDIELLKSTYLLRLKSYQPRTIAYFSVVD